MLLLGGRHPGLKLLESASLRRIRSHDLRHTFASMSIPAGAPPPYVRDLMGHSGIKITVDIYGHLTPSADITCIDRMEQVATVRHPGVTNVKETEGRYSRSA